VRQSRGECDLGCLSLLRSLYEEPAIPRGVYLEVVQRGFGFPGSLETEKTMEEDWLKVRSVSNKAGVMDLMRRYGISLRNAETVQLALEDKAELALADEAEVRDILEEYGVKVRGRIGVLIEAAKRGKISPKEAGKAMRRLVETGYRVSDNVLNEAYRLLGEEQ